MVSSTTREVATESQLRLLAALVGLAGGRDGPDTVAFSTVAYEAAAITGAEASGVLRYLGEERAVVVGVWREGGARTLPINAELDFGRTSALGRARSTGLPARSDRYDEMRGEIRIVMEAVGLRSSIAAPIVLAERPWGAVVASTTREEPFPPEAEHSLAGVAELLAQAVAGAESRRALETSRRRIVEGADSARRRLERSLHEGTHQHLLALMLKLRMARSQAGPDSALASLLDDAIEGAMDADASLRDLARGLFPVVLGERGLSAAVQALAVRASVPVRLHRLPSGRFAPLVEATAYFTVDEALADVAGRADATEVSVAVADQRDRLAIEVRDDGSGQADEARLRALGDRVAAVGGVLTVDSSRGGNVVRAEIPFDPAAP
jgi:signal transduction histidine kinase